jgi:dTDP-4-amino-4,6-dideoxygalactose transaminase
MREFLATAGALATGHVLRGRHTALFSQSVAHSLGKRYAVAFNRGRFAIEVILRGLKIGPGDEVVVPSYVCSTVIEGIAASGAVPRFADVDNDLHMSLECALAALTPATKCVVVPHLFGRAAPVDEIEAAMRERGIPIIDDAAQSFGTYVRDRPVGSYGVAGVVGCGAGKNLSGAAGGLLITDDIDLYQFAVSQSSHFEPVGEVVRRLLSHWLFRRLRYFTLPIDYLLHSVGERPRAESRARMSNVDAAIGRAQLAKASKIAERRRSNAAWMAKVFSQAGIRVIDNFASSQVALKLIFVLPDTGPSRVDALRILADAGIECQTGYGPCHLASGLLPVLLPGTEAIWQRVVCVPLERTVSRKQLAEIARLLHPNVSDCLAGPAVN